MMLLQSQLLEKCTRETNETALPVSRRKVAGIELQCPFNRRVAGALVSRQLLTTKSLIRGSLSIGLTIGLGCPFNAGPVCLLGDGKLISVESTPVR